MKFKRMLAALGAAVMMAGCGSDPNSAWENPTVAQEPVPTAAVTESAGHRFEFGDIAWSLWQAPDRQWRLERHAVVSQEGAYLTVTSCVTDDPDVLRQVLPEYLENMERDYPDQALELMLVADCYATEADAQAAADELNEVTGCE